MDSEGTSAEPPIGAAGCWTFGPAITSGSGRSVRGLADLHASYCPVLRQWRRADELICRADEPAGVLETAGMFAPGALCGCCHARQVDAGLP